MKTILASILVCVFLQVVWVSFSTGLDAEAATDCSTLISSTCCNQNCSLFACNETTTVCVDTNMTNTDVCGNDTILDQCQDQPTTTPATPGTTTPDATDDSCSRFKDNTTCCNITTGCAFFSCIAKDEITKSVCAENETSALTQCGEGFTTSNDTCDNPTPTTTIAPVTTPKAEVCSDHNDNKSACCEATTVSCAFYNCTNADKTQSSTVCVVNSTTEDKVCTKDGDTADLVQCDDKPSSSTPVAPTSTVTPEPTSSEQPTQAPSTGGDSGRHFDGASFIGGIVLCAGLVAIGFFGLKFYKNRQERNYHTL